MDKDETNIVNDVIETKVEKKTEAKKAPKPK